MLICSIMVHSQRVDWCCLDSIGTLGGVLLMWLDEWWNKLIFVPVNLLLCASFRIWKTSFSGPLQGSMD